MLDPYRECIGDGILVGTASTQPKESFCTALNPQEGCCRSQMAARGEHVVNEDYSLPLNIICKDQMLEERLGVPSPALLVGGRQRFIEPEHIY